MVPPFAGSTEIRMLHFSKYLSTSIITVSLSLSSRHGVVVMDNITCFNVIVIGNLKTEVTVLDSQVIVIVIYNLDVEVIVVVIEKS